MYTFYLVALNYYSFSSSSSSSNDNDNKSNSNKERQQQQQQHSFSTRMSLISYFVRFVPYRMSRSSTVIIVYISQNY